MEEVIESEQDERLQMQKAMQESQNQTQHFNQDAELQRVLQMSA